MTASDRFTGSDRFIARFSWIGRFFQRSCPECTTILPMSELASRNGAWPQVAVCKGCSTPWRITHGRSGLMLKTFFVAFPMVFIWTGIVSLILTKIPLFVMVKANGQEGLNFLSALFLIPTFFLSYRRFLCRLPLKKAET